MKLILFPHQLFAPSILKQQKATEIHLVEHTLFYGERKYKYINDPVSSSPKASPMKFNKKKLLLHRASMLAYIDECKDAGLKVVFHENISSLKTIRTKLFHTRSLSSLASLDVYYYDPVDHELQVEMNNAFPTAERLDTPLFLFTVDQLLSYFKGLPDPDKTPTTLSHSAFYKYSIETHHIPYIRKSYDTENRQAIPLDKIPPRKFKTYHDDEYMKKAVKWVEQHNTYKKFYGSLDDETLWLGCTRKHAHSLLTEFLSNHLREFGQYQDAMAIQHPFLHHSKLSAFLNIGLLTPREVVDATVKYYQKHRGRIPIASFEGFIRQVAGWREYERLIYLVFYPEIVKSNIFKNRRKLSRVWYPVEDERKWLTPLNDAIDQAWTYGYLHHIYRLMVVGNAMNLMSVDPYEAYRWFMEFSVDSYDWVMIGNVYSMGMWADGGKTMRKPYLSSNAYIENMSVGYEKDWGDAWRALFYRFLSQHKEVIQKTIYVRNLATYQKMNVKNRMEMEREAREVERYYTHI